MNATYDPTHEDVLDRLADSYITGALASGCRGTYTRHDPDIRGGLAALGTEDLLALLIRRGALTAAGEADIDGNVRYLTGPVPADTVDVTISL